MNLFGEKGIMSLTSFILAACIAQARRLSSGCGLHDQPSVVAIGLKLATCEPKSQMELHWISHEKLFVHNIKYNKVQEYHYRYSKVSISYF